MRETRIGLINYKEAYILSNDEGFSHVIEGVSRDSRGEINAYKLDTGELVSKEQAVLMAKQGALKGVSVVVSKNGEEFLRSLPDSDANNNLESLPNVEVQESWKSRNMNHR
ncbi:MAG: DUF3892 domain-containing protein [Clostridiaceae bacterium]|nr:DUF3892 domain-containing protein [Clostridiaceae bacterium]